VPKEYLWIDEERKFDFQARTIYFWGRRTKGHGPKLLLGRSPLQPPPSSNGLSALPFSISLLRPILTLYYREYIGYLSTIIESIIPKPYIVASIRFV
jgi:hypothetical protein